MLTAIFLIPWATTFTTFAQVSLSMYAALFGITQDPSGNPYLVTKLLPLSLGCTFVPYSMNIRIKVGKEENKIEQTKATFLTAIFLIPGATTFTTFAQVSLYMYDDLFGITQDPSINKYLVTKLLPLRLGCTFVPFARNITGSFTPAALPTQRTVMENLESLQFLPWRGLLLSPIILNSPSLQRKQASSKFN